MMSEKCSNPQYVKITYVALHLLLYRPLIHCFFIVYKSFRFLKMVDLQGTAYQGSATLRRFKNPALSTMLVG